jgi:hypothetical protein
MCPHRATSRQLTVSASHDRLEFRSHATAAKTNMETPNGLGPSATAIMMDWKSGSY